MVDKKNIFVTVLISLLMATGVTITDKTVIEGANELDGYYICDVLGTDSIAEYARLSGTKYSAYPYMDSRVSAKTCKTADGTKGTWHTLSEYAIELGVDPYELLVQKSAVEPTPVEPTPHDGAKVKCGQDGCYSV